MNAGIFEVLGGDKPIKVSVSVGIEEIGYLLGGLLLICVFYVFLNKKIIK